MFAGGNGAAMTTIAYIANAFPSPVERYVIDEICELRRRGVQVICFSANRTSRRGLNEIECQFHDETRVIRPVPPLRMMKALSRIVSAWRTVRPMLKHGRKESVNARQCIRTAAHTVLGAALADELAPLHVDHVHAHHGYYGSWMALTAARLLGIGFSFTLHGSDLLLDENLLGTKLHFCRFCVTISNYNRDYLLQKFPQARRSRILVQRLGVDPPIRLAAHSGKAEQRTPLLLAVGRLKPIKNHEFLLQVCAALRNEGRRFQCWIAGDGPEYSKLNRLIRTLDLQRRVCLLGHVGQPRLSAMYARADIVVLTSHSEGIPLVLMEAMAHGRLVLAPAITGIPELIQHGKNGFLYQPGSMVDFVDSVRWILERRASLDEVRRAAIETISSRYDRAQNVRNFADHFLERLAKPSDEHENSLLQQV